MTSFSLQIIRWQAQHGRSSLPWQNTKDPYRVWLSEIMLQQTQVATVIDYFTRFIQRFPSVAQLAAASQDEVLGLWSGLGYYSRARNLHRCAQDILALHAGQFPRSAEALQSLPGIGRSTAAAIAAFCYGERVAILDGNVKRVLTRYLGYEADLAIAANERALWDEATKLLPQRDLQHNMPRYTQGLMDLGASLCTTRSPQCHQCPIQSQCQAQAQGRCEVYPVKSRKLKRSVQTLWLLQAQTKTGKVWLVKRSASGIWAGLYCLPVFDSREELLAKLPLQIQESAQDQGVHKHVLTHKDLYLHIVRANVPSQAMPATLGRWCSREEWQHLGLPAPVRRLLL